MEFNDFVHGRILVPDIIGNIIQTPHFQRLQHIKQLGFVYKDFPAATYTRFMHSIGTFHLASIMLTRLEQNGNWITRLCEDETEYEIYKMYCLAVKIAALLHDVGHGPFSHSWERIASKYHHEHIAMDCIDDIFDNLESDVLPELRANNNYGIELIKALILGDFEGLDPPFPVQYRFLFEIVHNKQCELDVDKLDYLKHDHYFAKMICNGFNDLGDELDCIFFEARVGEQGRHIEYRYQDFEKIYNLFEARAKLHIHFYHMPKAVACEYLVQQIIKTGILKIDEIPIGKVVSRPMKTFFKLVDEKVLQIIKGHKLFAYFDNTNRLELIANDYINSQNEKIIELQIFVKGAGDEMPADKRFHFYGNPESKKDIVRDENTTTLIRRFRLLDQE